MDDDRTLPFELPAAALKWALCRVFVGFRQEMTAFKAWASHAGQMRRPGATFSHTCSHVLVEAIKGAIPQLSTKG